MEIPIKMIESDASVIGTLSIAFLANMMDVLGAAEVSTYFTTGTFMLAMIVGIIKAKVYYLELQIKKIELQKLEEDEET